jgi:hypothetical protein
MAKPKRWHELQKAYDRLHVRQLLKAYKLARRNARKG